MRILGEATVARFAVKHAAARKPLQRFLVIARAAVWPHLAAVKQTFSATDTGKRTGRLIFDVGGNNYRVIASVDFAQQLMVIEDVLLHKDYDREVF
jgi:mRNA interferase HigB